MAEPKRIYWDADVFLSYLNDEPNRSNVIETILDQVASERKLIIVTSTLSGLKWLGPPSRI